MQHALPDLLQSCDDCPIRHRAVCARCEPAELRRLEEIKFYRSFEAGQTIVWAGDRMEFVGSVVTGVATLSQTMEDGRTQMVGLLFPSDFIGRPGRSVAPFDVVAVADSVICCFRRRPFENTMVQTPHLSQRLLEMSLDELDAAREWMLLLGRKTAREKIASLIAIIARRETSLANTLPTRADGHQRCRSRGRRWPTISGSRSRPSAARSRRSGARALSALKASAGLVIPDFDQLVEESGDDADGGYLG